MNSLSVTIAMIIVYVPLILAFVFLLMYVIPQFQERKIIKKIISKNRLPIHYGKHYATFQNIKKIRVFLLMIVSSIIGIAFYSLKRTNDTALAMQLLGVLFLLFAIEGVLLWSDQALIKKYSIKYDSKLIISNRTKKIKNFGVTGFFICTLWLGVIFLLAYGVRV